MRTYDLTPVAEEWPEHEQERDRAHAEVVLRGPVVWRLELSAEFARLVSVYQVGTSFETEQWSQTVEVSALYAHDAVAAVARVLPDVFDDREVTVRVTGPDGSVSVFAVETQVVRERIVELLEGV